MGRGVVGWLEPWGTQGELGGGGGMYAGYRRISTVRPFVAIDEGVGGLSSYPFAFHGVVMCQSPPPPLVRFLSSIRVSATSACGSRLAFDGGVPVTMSTSRWRLAFDEGVRSPPSVVHISCSMGVSCACHHHTFDEGVWPSIVCVWRSMAVCCASSHLCMSIASGVR